MACEIGDTVEMTIMSDDEESDSEGDPHPLQQASPGSVFCGGFPRRALRSTADL